LIHKSSPREEVSIAWVNNPKEYEINDDVSHRIGSLWIRWVVFGVLCDKIMPPKLKGH